MPRFSHTFTVGAPLNAVVALHHDTRILKRLTPPPLFIQLHRFEPLADGAEAEFTMWFGPLPVRWVAVHSEVGPEGFVDRQVRGPLARWRHRHHFAAVDAENTRVTDTVDYLHRSGWRGRLTGLFFNKPGLALLFTFRKWATRWYLRPAQARSQIRRGGALTALLRAVLLLVYRQLRSAQ